MPTAPLRMPTAQTRTSSTPRPSPSKSTWPIISVSSCVFIFPLFWPLRQPLFLS